MKRLTAEQLAKALRRAARKVGGQSDLAAAALRESASAIREYLCESDEQRRERFEAWCVASFAGEVDGDALARRDDGRYLLGWINDRWQAFHAALTWRGEMKGGAE